VGVGPADRRGGLDRGMLEQRVLDRGGIDVVPAADDEVLGTAGEGDEAVVVDRSEIAGVEPAVAELAVRAQLGPRLAADQIALDDPPEAPVQGTVAIPSGPAQTTCSPLSSGPRTVTSSAFVWNSGRAANTVLPGRNRSGQVIIHALATSLAWVRAASFGVPVVPPVCR
jgi:hypothetical protein